MATQKQDKLDKRAAALRNNLKRRKAKQQEQDTDTDKKNKDEGQK